jgi:hypothetical protein
LIDTGNWLSGRKVLAHPSAIGTPDHQEQNLPVRLSKAQVEASFDIEQDRPVTMQMQSDLHSYYGWDPHLGSHIPATDGVIGHVENFLLDDADWAIRYLIVDTRKLVAGRVCADRAIRRERHRLERPRGATRSGENQSEMGARRNGRTCL